MGGSGPRDEAAQSLNTPVLIFGLGFTGTRLARRLLLRPGEVFAAVRNPERFRDLAPAGVKLLPFGAEFPRNGLLFHSIPPLPLAENQEIRRQIEQCAPRRVVYISSTGVYGRTTEVDARTPPSPTDERGFARLREEEWIARGPWASIVLRAAAIYGPGRGVHVAIRQGRIPRGSDAGIVSRIHVDDLAAIAEAALFSPLEGVWPVADLHPCPSAEIAAAIGGSEPGASAQPQVRISGRKVDGTAILEALGISLACPGWESGIPASIAEENAASVRAITPGPG